MTAFAFRVLPSAVIAFAATSATKSASAFPPTHQHCNTTVAMSSSTSGAINTAAPSLPSFSGKGKKGWFSKAECQQVLACTNLEYDILRQQMKLIGHQPIFDGKALLRENFSDFDPDGAHRAHLCAEVERSSALFAELFSGTRQNCDSKTWSQYLGRAQSSMIKNLGKKSDSTYGDDSELTDTTQGTTSHGGLTPSIPSKRSSGSEDFDLSSHSRPARKRFATFKARELDHDSFDQGDEESPDEPMSDSEGIIEAGSRKSKPLRKHCNVYTAPSSNFGGSSPLPHSANSYLEEAELTPDNRYTSVGTFDHHDRPVIQTLGLEIQLLFNKHWDERTADLGRAYDQHLTQQLEAEQKRNEAKIAACRQEFQTKLESIRKKTEAKITALNAKHEIVMNEKDVQLADEMSKFEADTKAEAEARIAAAIEQKDSLVEKTVQSRVKEEKLKWMEALQNA